MNDTTTNDSQVLAMGYSSESLLVTDDEIYPIGLLDRDAADYDKGIAYLDGDYYYIYRGEKSLASKFLKPGIYKDTKTNSFFFVDPLTEEDQKRYASLGKIAQFDPKTVIDIANVKKDLLIAIPESTKIFMPSLTTEDDILKRLAKQALIRKSVDIDKIKSRFQDKNALFNFKQVIKGENKLSILIFDRGMDALNLKYTIVVEEKDPETAIGDALTEPILASSEDTYDV